LGGEKIEDCLVSHTRLVRFENVAGVRDQYEFGPRNTVGD
jgi:hypothetical protein